MFLKHHCDDRSLVNVKAKTKRMADDPESWTRPLLCSVRDWCTTDSMRTYKCVILQSIWLSWFSSSVLFVILSLSFRQAVVYRSWNAETKGRCSRLSSYTARIKIVLLHCQDTQVTAQNSEAILIGWVYKRQISILLVYLRILRYFSKLEGKVVFCAQV